MIPQIDNQLDNQVISNEIITSKTYKLNNDIPTTIKEKQEPEIIENTTIQVSEKLADGIAKLSVYGNTYQFQTTTGKNLFDGWVKNRIISSTNGTITNNTGSAICSLASNLIPVKENTTYTFSQLIPTSWGKNKFVAFYRQDKTYISRTNFNNVTNLSFTTPADTYYCAVTINHAFDNENDMNSAYNDSQETQLELGSSATSYEPYIPNRPSPEYPSDIRNVGDNINLFNINGNVNMKVNGQLMTGTNTVSGNVLTTTANSSNTRGIGQKINVKAGQTIIASAKVISIGTGNTGRLNIIQFKNNVFYKQSFKNALADRNIKVISTIEDNVTEVYLTFLTVGGTGAKFTDIQVKLDNPSSYTPYNCGGIDIIQRSRNLFDKDNQVTIKGYTQASSGKIVESSTACITYIKCEKNTTYTVQKISSKIFNLSYTKTIPLIGTDFYGRVIGGTGTQLSITTGPDAEYLIIDGFDNDTDVTWRQIVDSIQIEQGSVANPYTPYKEQLIHFPLSEGQVLHKGDYLAEDGIHQTKATLVLDGTENYIKYNEYSNSYSFVLTTYKSITDTSGINIKCNILTPKTTNEADTIRVVSTNGNIVLCFNKNFVEHDVTSLKAKITDLYNAGTPVIIEIPLIKERVISYTEEQQNIFNKIKTIKLYINSTNITTPNNLAILKLQYYPIGTIDFKTQVSDRILGYVDNLEAVKQAIYHILATERYAYLIYDDNYGVELEQYIGKDFEYLQATIEETLNEALTYDLRINSVIVNSVERISKEIALVNFTVDTIYGDLILEVNINV